jgi:dihydroxyacid dehydratase/phosphogluconate dehydratase
LIDSTRYLLPQAANVASLELMFHTGRAVVFESVQDLTERIDDPDLDLTPQDVLVLRNAGPRGAPGMPEAGYLPIPLHRASLAHARLDRASLRAATSFCLSTGLTR